MPPLIAPTITLSQFAAVFSCFAVLFAGAMLWPLTGGNVAFDRTHATAWSMALLATPAMYLFVRNFRWRPLDNWWRLFWSFGWLTCVVHFYFGLFQMHDGRPITVFERQGFLLAFSIFFFISVWGIDVGLAWARRDWATAAPYMRAFAFAVGFLTFFISTVIFNNDLPSFLVGLVMAAAVAVAILQRWLPTREVTS